MWDNVYWQIMTIPNFNSLLKHVWSFIMIVDHNKFFLHCLTGCAGLICPCMLFGHNVETLREEIPWTNACVCHGMCIEGGLTLTAATVLFHGVDPKTSFLILEGLLFAWWMCGIYTGMFRQALQKKYHLKVIFLSC